MRVGMFFAAALAAGTVSFAAHSQEAPAQTMSSAEKGDGDATSAARDAGPVEQRFRWGEGGETQGLDRTTTASVGSKDETGSESGSGSESGYNAIVTRYAGEYGVPASLAHAVIRIESNYRADARGRAGEVGLMQIKPSTARGIGYTGGAKGLYDPDTNIRWGMKYLGMAHELGGGDTCGTLLRYNAGHAATRMNSISAAYCAKVKRHLGAG